jgi:hypothetical protein
MGGPCKPLEGKKLARAQRKSERAFAIRLSRRAGQKAQRMAKQGGGRN